MKSPSKIFTFPPGFLWGTATSAHQVEGNNYHSDWWAWEQTGRRGEDKKSGVACNQWFLYLQDFQLSRELGHNAHRFSIEWAKVEPEEGQFDQAVLEHYGKVLESLAANKLVPFVTLHHFTNPAWFTAKGGWERRENIADYLRYVEKVVNFLGKQVIFWLTLNEPVIFATQGWVFAKWPPEKSFPLLAKKVLDNEIYAHNEAYKIIHASPSGGARVQVGVAQSYVRIVPRYGLLDRWLAKFLDYAWNHYFLDRTQDHLDFIGINYYQTNVVHRQAKFPYYQIINTDAETNDLGWEIKPVGLYEGLLQLKKYGQPVYVTENGLADAKDEKRAKFIYDHLTAVSHALEDGVDVRGYFHWSLIDNFEWAEGFAPRFGLVEVDYKTQKRTPRPSAFYYERICRTNSLIPYHPPASLNTP